MDHQLFFPCGLSVPVVLALLVLLAATAALIRHFMRQRRPAIERQQHAHDLIAALEQYCDWVEAQRHVAFFTDESAHADSPIERARAIKHAHFPELSQAMVELLMAHTALVDFFWTQQVRRMKEPQAWADTAAQRDATYLELRQRMLAAVRKLAEGCRDIVGELPMPAAVASEGLETAGA